MVHEVPEQTPEEIMAQRTQAGLDNVKPRNRSQNPRCADCKSGPMYHPAHVWGPCQVMNRDLGVVCGCTSVRTT